MAELDGLRIYSLTDEQSSYSPDIYLVVDDSSFTSGSKKIKMSTIYPLTNTLGAITTYTPTSAVLRLNNGSGTDNKITVENLLKNTATKTLLTSSSVLNLDVSALSFTDISPANVTLTQLSGNKLNKIQFITGRLTVTATTGAEYSIATITGYQSPGFDVYFPLSASINTNENAYGRISTGGNIYASFFNNGVWNFNCMIIGA